MLGPEVVYVAETPDDPRLDDARVVFVNGLAGRPVLELARRVKDTGGRLVVDFESFLEPPPYHVHLYDHLSVRPVPDLLLGSADRVIAASENLADELRKVNTAVVVIPSLPELCTEQPRDAAAGLGIEQDDIAIALQDACTPGCRPLAGVMHALADRHSRLRFLVIDELDPPPWMPLDRTIRTADRKAACAADIGIAPLERSLFDLCEPATFAIELGAAGVPVVASAWGEYQSLARQGAPFQLAEGEGEWFSLLDALVADEVLRRESGARLQRYASEWMRAVNPDEAYLRVISEVCDA